MLYLCLFGPPHGCYPLDLKVLASARYAMWVSMLSMWGCRVVVGYVLGIMLGMGCGWCLDGNVCRLGCAGRAVLLANGYWTLAVEIPLDPEPQKCEKKASCVGINDKMQIISANDFKFKKQALTLWVGIANIRLVLTIPL